MTLLKLQPPHDLVLLYLGPVAKYVFIVCHSEQGEESLAF